MNKMDKVINGPDPNLPPSSDPMDASIVTRFVKEFELQQEALALQVGVNSVIRNVNKYLGFPEEGSAAAAAAAAGGQHRPGRPVGGTSSSTTSSVAQTGGLLGTVLSIPQAIGGAAASAIQFLSPGSNQARKIFYIDSVISLTNP